MTVDPSRLVARTVRVDREIDLLAVAGSDGVLFSRGRVGFAGRGVACRVPRADVVDLLAAITVDGHQDQPGPVAVGAVPFLPDAPCDFVVPSIMVARRDDGTRWVTTVGPIDGDPGPGFIEHPTVMGADATPSANPLLALEAALADSTTSVPPLPGPSSFQVSAARAPSTWTEAVAEATRRIATGQLDKVVLAREVTVTADAPIPVATVLTRLAQGYPECFLYLVDGFCGASPELLVGRSGDVVRAQPMAGTAPRRGDPAADARLAADLLASPTYRHEHQVTIDAVHDGLLDYCSYVDDEPEPSVVALANVAHLATSVEGRLSHPPASILELVSALHPTPAVCGRPRDAALEVIAELEALDRGPYAGAVGWVDAAGNGQFAVAIRGAVIDGPRARVMAGNGIVADSDPATELTETRAKLQAMLSAIVRP